jgi:hypothetical protein
MCKLQLAANTESNAIHVKVMSAYTSGSLTTPQVKWHLSVGDIDMENGVQLVDALIKDGMSILKDVNIETLLNCMTIGYQDMVRSRHLFEHSADRSTSSIIHHWQQGEKLTPPTILVFTEEHFRKIGREHLISSVELVPIDGKHRLNAAYYFGETKIPILVRNPQLELIKTMLKNGN